ncbi:MAG: phosphate acyltransferase, partial [Planctomycetota bacterium]|jgi:malate dehydrogenase (oxaloacetate-decarboxylating)(NADP+)
VNPRRDERRQELAQLLYGKRWRRGMNMYDAGVKVSFPRRYAMLLLERGDVDCVVTGVNSSYPDSVRDALQIVGTGGRNAAALHVMVLKDRTLFLADTSLNIDPSARQLADIAIAAAEAARSFDFEPKVAAVSFSNFGSVHHPSAAKTKEAVALVRAERPDITIDGEMHADVALSPRVAKRLFPDSLIQGDANVIVCPDLASGNIAYKFLEHLAGAEAIGPILLGIDKPVVVTYQAASVQTIVNLTTIALARGVPGAAPASAGP